MLCRVAFFFFQAEDGIRDWSVTGVQTCALPIFSEATHLSALWRDAQTMRAEDRAAIQQRLLAYTDSIVRDERSEEHTSELQSLTNLVCRLLLEKKNQLARHLNDKLTNISVDVRR